MIHADEMSFFLDNGYLVVPGALDAGHLQRVRDAADRVWREEKGSGTDAQTDAGAVGLEGLLRNQVFVDLLDHPPLTDRLRAVFGDQTQLIQYDLLRQGPRNTKAERSWHRDFVFPGDLPIAINTIVFLDDMTPERGPTCVVPGSHRGPERPPRDERSNGPLPGEVALTVAAGSAIFINASIWHSGGRNTSEGLRRGIFMFCGYWWVKLRPEGLNPIPWQALMGATPQRLQMLGLKIPDERGMFTYET